MSYMPPEFAQEPIEITLRVIAVLEKLEIRYLIGGSLASAIYGEPSLSRYGYASVASIHIIVKNGNVTLEGYVDNDADKNMANIRANGVPNVFSVKNNLQVASGGK